MYAIAVSIALALYTVILVDFGLVFHEISVNTDVVTASQALYTAEGAAEYTLWATASDAAGDKASRNIKFTDDQETQMVFLEFNEDAQSAYMAKELTLNHPDLQVSDAYNALNRSVRSKAYLTEEKILDPFSYYGFEPVKAGGFIFREVNAGTYFNELNLDYRFEEGAQDGGILFEIFAFPREGSALVFDRFKSLKDFPESSLIQRVVINTAALTSNTLSAGGHTFTVNASGSALGEYSKTVNVRGFAPSGYNYIIRFQTLNNKPVTYRLSAKNNSGPVALPNLLQTVDVIGTTSTGLYQRVKVQRESEENVQPGLNFVLFGNTDINK
ncbi:hypothetical protein JXA05_04655 [Candidatus Peregrinibacteria bacterium]|nr:hypothetical protein [Candidatus Peregrinibacteria bacterium]